MPTNLNAITDVMLLHSGRSECDKKRKQKLSKFVR